MFNVGGMELIVIGIVALIVLGPDKLPGAIRQVGQVVGELRRISSGFQTDLRGAISEAERDAEREAQQKANRAAPASATPDPGAARAAAHAELAAAEAALDAEVADGDEDADHQGNEADRRRQRLDRLVVQSAFAALGPAPQAADDDAGEEVTENEEQDNDAEGDQQAPDVDTQDSAVPDVDDEGPEFLQVFNHGNDFLANLPALVI